MINIARKHLENVCALLNALSEPNIIALKQRVGRCIYLYRFVSHPESCIVSAKPLHLLFHCYIYFPLIKAPSCFPYVWMTSVGFSEN